jgi:glucose-1-phosphate cytidylyltransferase
VTYGDGLSNVDLTKAAAFHRSHGKLATLTGVRPPSRFGELGIEGHRVTNFSEKPTISEGVINGGFMFFEPEFLKYLSTDQGCILERTGLDRSAKEGQLHVYEHLDYWQCMDTYREWEILEKQWQQNAAPWKVWE